MKTVINMPKHTAVSAISTSAMNFITYGLTEADVQRRKTDKDFGKVGMNDILEIDKPKVTPYAIKRAKESTWAKYVAVSVYDKSGKEVSTVRL